MSSACPAKPCYVYSHVPVVLFFFFSAFAGASQPCTATNCRSADRRETSGRTVYSPAMHVHPLVHAQQETNMAPTSKKIAP